MIRSFSIIILLYFIVFSKKITFAFENESTHPEISELALFNSLLIEDYLINGFGFHAGLREKLTISTGVEKTINEWVREGSTLEDDPMCRASNHFHNPIAGTWADGRLTDGIWFAELYCGINEEKYSSLIWATGMDEDGPITDPPNNELGPDNGRNWNVARGLFYLALTDQDPGLREGYLAESFKTLGHIMHLLEDSAVPAHVRNDMKGHLYFLGITKENILSPKEWFGNPFEYYVASYFAEIEASIGSNTLPFTGEKSPANFWDTDSYNGNSPPTFSTDLGLSE